MQMQDWGWPAFLGLFLLGLALLALLLRIDRKAKHPFIDVKLLKDRSFVGGCLATFCAQFVLMATIFWAIYFQLYLNFSPAYAGTLSLISNIPIIFMAPVAGHLADRFGPRIPIVLGFSLILFSLLWFVIFGETKILDGCFPPWSPSVRGLVDLHPERGRDLLPYRGASARPRFGLKPNRAPVRRHARHGPARRLPPDPPTLQAELLMKGDPSLKDVHAGAWMGSCQKLLLHWTPSADFPHRRSTMSKRAYLKAYAAAFSGMNLLAAGIALIGIILTCIFLGRHPGI